jgi:hypothetical protein
MSLTTVGSRQLTKNPLDLVEELVSVNDWAYERAAVDELAVEVSGRWSEYRLFFLWQEDAAAMHFSCLFDHRVPNRKFNEVSRLLAIINEKLWLGHFDLSSDDGTPVFRHTLLLRGIINPSVEQMEDMIDYAMTECERFFPAFQFVVWGGKEPNEALAAAMIDVEGEA